MFSTDALITLIAVANSHAAQNRLIALMGLGFLVGIFGHLIGSRAVIAIGIALFFAATFLIPVLLYR